MHTEEEYQALKNTLNRTRKVQKKAEELLESKSRELYESNQTLIRQQTQLIQQEKMASVGQLSAGIAHEINNPIGFIISNLASLQEYQGDLKDTLGEVISFFQAMKSSDTDDLKSKISELDESFKNKQVEFLLEDSEDLLKETVEGCSRVKDIVMGLKNFVHLDSQLELKEVDINAELENTLKVTQNEIKYSVKEVKNDFDDLPTINCVGGQINQVFMNMLVNASQAIEKDGVIEIKTVNHGEFVAIHISDNGTGIEEKNLINLFQPFFTTKEVGKGTGLGLSISKGIIESHHGTIRVKSEVGVGTTFTIEIPVGIEKLKEKR
jgi:two-component system, NtrC family, sensor kinase